jgi:hydrogenase/urease accessory protein HupE
MKVEATFGSRGDYRIVAMVHPDHFPDDVNPFAGLNEQNLGEIDARLARFRARFQGSARVEFDGEPVALTAEPQEAPVGRIGILMTGPVPRGARNMTWSTSLPTGAYFLSLQNEGDPEPQSQWVDGGKTSKAFSLRHARPLLSRWQVIALYLQLGFTHIVPRGADHILFVLGIYLLTLEKRSILLQVTAFTVAHSITLALTIYGVVSLSPRIVEPLIALSIVCVAVENLFVRRFHLWRLALVFAFGLLHGMGFAGVLRELGIPRSQFIPALVSFNVGVEGGQLAVIAAAFLLVGLWFGKKTWYRSRITIPASACIGVIGVYWTVERVFL